MNTQAPAGTRVCACVREIAGRQGTAAQLAKLDKWTLKAPAGTHICARVCA